jgi:hypothetical protein
LRNDFAGTYWARLNILNFLIDAMLDMLVV